MTINDILKVKGSRVWTIKSGQTVKEALALLCFQNIGALVVMDDKNRRIMGIISERDIVHGCFRRNSELEGVLVCEMMTREVITARPEDSVENLMSMMTERRVRHIPILAEDQLVGLVSIGDIVKSALQESSHQIRYLKEFMYGPSAEEAV